MPEISRAGHGLQIELEEYEAELLRRLANEMSLLLGTGIPTDDAVAARLFPAAYDDPEEERAYRRMTGDDLNEAKKRALKSVSDGLGDAGPVTVSLRAEEVDAWLTFLTDSRLALGTRLDVDEETMSRDVDTSGPDAVALSVLHWLGFVQESFLEHMMDDT